MSPTMQMAVSTATYTPTTDVMDRHEYGVTKSRKAASTGGGRAWSEDEELYLLQTRLQKMPYKHIAAHLKKTELACRLHYHQLSHGSNRRKRTTSVSSGSSIGGRSPTLPANLPSPIHESAHGSVSPAGSPRSYGPGSPIQLPAILGRASDASPTRLPAILPKPAAMTLALSNPAGNIACSALTASPTTSRGYPTPLVDSHPQSAALSAPTGFPMAAPTTSAPQASASTGTGRNGLAPLRLDYTTLPPLSSASSSLSIDMGRLNSVYAVHRATFWAAVAAEYGPGMSPAVLETAWKNGPGCQAQSPSSAAMPSWPGSASSGSTAHTHGNQAQTPITPVGSPDGSEYSLGRLTMGLYGSGGYGSGYPANGSNSSTGDKTRISAILGIDANPRSPKEREMVKRIEKEREGLVTASA